MIQVRNLTKTFGDFTVSDPPSAFLTDLRYAL